MKEGKNEGKNLFADEEDGRSLGEVGQRMALPLGHAVGVNPLGLRGDAGSDADAGLRV